MLIVPFRVAVLFVATLTCLVAGQQQPSDFQNLVTSGNLEGMNWPNFSDYRTLLQKFYVPTGYAPAWIQGAQPIPQALALIEVFRNAEKKGLDPEDYDASRWEKTIRALRGSPTARGVGYFDLALTICTMRYVPALHIGRIGPQHFEFGLRMEQKQYDLVQFLRDRVMTTSNLGAVLDALEPPFGSYHRTEQALAHYIELARIDNGGNLPAVTKPVNPGQSYSGVPRLARLLRLVGDLPADARHVIHFENGLAGPRGGFSIPIQQATKYRLARSIAGKRTCGSLHSSVLIARSTART